MHTIGMWSTDHRCGICRDCIRVPTSLCHAGLISFNAMPILREVGSGGTCLQSLYLGGRGRRISEFEARLVYNASTRLARAT